MFALIPCETVEVSQDDQIGKKHDLQFFSWWMDKN